jgi:DNA polymerase III alpha subunit
VLSVNTHINSPYSFSSFDSIEQVVKSAREEMISVLGISDTGTMDGLMSLNQLVRDRHLSSF